MGLDTAFGNVNPEQDTAELIIWNRLTNVNAAYLVNKNLREDACVWWNWIPQEYEMI